MKRYRTIDGLRGYAALAVVFYHLTAPVREPVRDKCPWILMQFFEFGFLGVPVFFVISGFAIASSVRNVTVTRSFLGNFILRRALRLDPPYWAALGLGLVLLWAKNLYLGTNQSFPSLGQIVAHLFYLQHLLGFPDAISIVFWTLCQEVQLYLFFVLATWCAQRLTSSRRNVTNDVQFVLMASLGVYSLALDHKLAPTVNPGLFFPNWHYFLLGVLCFRVLKREPRSHVYLGLWLLVEIAFQSSCDWRAYAVCGIITASALWVIAIADKMDWVLTDRLSLYLGSISYSLYLFHADIGWKSVQVGIRKFDPANPVAAGLVVLTSVAICVLVSHLIFHGIEKPSSRLSAKFRREWKAWQNP